MADERFPTYDQLFEGWKQMQAERDRLRAALTGAVEVIKTWHNMSRISLRGDPTLEAVWDIYWRNAPEMKPIREALAAVETDGNQADPVSSGTGVPAPTPRGSLPNSLGVSNSLEIVPEFQWPITATTPPARMRVAGPEASGEATGPEGDDSNMGTAPTSGPEATSSQGVAVETRPQAPIANLIIDENGECSAACMYAPGLPPGAHDVYCETTARQVPRKGWMIEKVGSSPPQWWKGTECNLLLDEAWTTDPNNTAVFASDTSALVVQMALARNTWRYPERTKAVGKLTVSEHEWPAVETTEGRPWYLYHQWGQDNDYKWYQSCHCRKCADSTAAIAKAQERATLLAENGDG